MRSEMKRIGKLCLGWALIVLGIAGLFLPVLQGILFLLLGLYVLSHESKWAQALLVKIRTRYPSLHDKFEQAKRKQKELFRRLFGK